MVTVTKYVWDPVFDCVTHELDENNVVKAEYHNEPQQYGGVLSQRRGTTSHYHHHDALGSTRFLTDSSCNVTDTYLHDAWGNLIASTGTTVNPFKWVGKYGYYTDNSTAQVYIRARMYQPTAARWCSVDPTQSFPDAWYYAYSLNRPSALVDESGHSCCYSALSFDNDCVNHQVDLVIDVGAVRKDLPIKFKVFVKDCETSICVHVHARRYLEHFLKNGTAKTMAESIERYRKNWNQRLRSGEYPGREARSVDPEWLFPNFHLLLNGCDGNNNYGGSYDGNSDNDWYMIVLNTFNSANNVCNTAFTTCWHEVGQPAKPATNPELTISHGAGSEEVCVDKCQLCMEYTSSFSVSLTYGDQGFGGRSASRVIRFGMLQERIIVPPEISD